MTFSQRQRRKNRMRAFSIIEAVVAAGIVGIGAVGMATYMSQRTAANADLNVQSDLEDLRAYVGSNLNCTKTMAAMPAGCTSAEQLIDAYDNNGKLIAKKDASTRIAEYGLRVLCVDGGQRMRVEATRFAKDGKSEAKSKLSAKAMSWTDLYRGIPVFHSNGSMPAVIDFESPPFNSPNYVLDQDFLWDNYGVRFKPIDKNGNVDPHGKMVIRRTSRRGESQPDNDEEAWLCVKCPGSPSKNRLMDEEEERRVGRYILSTDSATSTKHSGVIIEYKSPVHELSFDMIDIDGGERWTIQGYDPAGEPIKDTLDYLEADGYGKKSYTGQALKFEMKSNEPIASIRMYGEKKISYFGFAFDNFETGLSGGCTQAN